MMLVAVLSLQSAGQWLAGLQAHRHVHIAPQAPASALTQLLAHLHALQDPRLKAAPAPWPRLGRDPGLHAHGGVFHRHARHEAGTVDVAEAGEEAGPGGATAFLAWLPGAPGLALPEAASVAPGFIAPAWRDRIVAPALAPPRG